MDYHSIWIVWTTEHLFCGWRPSNEKLKGFQPKLDETLTGDKDGLETHLFVGFKVLWNLNKYELGA